MQPASNDDAHGHADQEEPPCRGQHDDDDGDGDGHRDQTNNAPRWPFFRLSRVAVHGRFAPLVILAPAHGLCDAPERRVHLTLPPFSFAQVQAALKVIFLIEHSFMSGFRNTFSNFADVYYFGTCR